ncbi:MAG TPA: phosphoribosylformylglycinamidine synthase subunit PurS [Nitrososphaerales archaeon]
MSILKIFKVEVIIENKTSIRDPEGETILHDLLVKNGFTQIKDVRTARMLLLEVQAENKNQAKDIVVRMCNELRIFNPIVSICKINVVSD